jgi:hypothetical protein
MVDETAPLTCKTQLEESKTKQAKTIKDNFKDRCMLSEPKTNPTNLSTLLSSKPMQNFST